MLLRCASTATGDLLVMQLSLQCRHMQFYGYLDDLGAFVESLDAFLSMKESVHQKKVTNKACGFTVSATKFQ